MQCEGSRREGQEEAQGEEATSTTAEGGGSIPGAGRPESVLAVVLATTVDGMLAIGEGGRAETWNRRFQEIWGLGEETLKTAADPAGLPEIVAQLKSPGNYRRWLARTAAHPDCEVFDVLELEDGRLVECHSRPRRAAGQSFGRVWCYRDITSRRRAEETRARLEMQVRHLHNMETIGLLASGLAHDFNNILSAIMGNAELIRLELPPENPAQLEVAEILLGARRAAELAKHMLVLTRHGEPERTLLDPATLVKEVLRLMRASLPANIEIETVLPAGFPLILGNAAQLHQVLINLFVNAWHAIGEQPGGLALRLEREQIAAGGKAGVALSPGSYVVLAVSDTGMGMDAATLSRIFEPFFTTKVPGKGSGLGLSLSRDIMRQHEGDIAVASRPGEGSTFRLYFPAQEGGETPADPAEAEVARGHGQHILLVDDEPALVDMGQRLLARLGYRVTAVNSPGQALVTFQEQPGTFAAVICDLTMTGLSGIELAERLHGLQQDMPIILTTGRAFELPPRQMRALGIRQVVPKPATLRMLGQALQRALGAA